MSNSIEPCLAEAAVESGPLPRRTSVKVVVGTGKGAIAVGWRGAHRRPIDDQYGHGRRRRDGPAGGPALARAGSELVRITVDRDEAAAAVPHIRDRLAKMGCHVPLVGDFHYIGHKLLAEHPACAEALDKYRINPGNVGFKDKRDRQFSAIVEFAIQYGKTVRIGANWGSLDQELLTAMMDDNAKSSMPLPADAVMR